MSKRKRSEICPTGDLHTDGYTVYRGAIDIKENSVSELIKRGRKGAIIFNHHETRPHNDRRRSQATIKGFSTGMGICINDFIMKQFPELTPTDWVVIHSKPDCGDQAAHCDYIPSHQMIRSSDSQFPLAVLVAVMPGTKLHVWPGSIRLAYTNPNIYRGMPAIHRKTVNLDPGDVLVFRGDLVHAGAAYKKENVRVHCFLDSDRVLRDPNRTYLINKSGNQDLIDVLGV